MKHKFVAILSLLVVASLAWGQSPIVGENKTFNTATWSVFNVNATPVSGASVAVVGVTGQATWYFWASTNYQIGSVISFLGSVSNAPNTLTSGNYVSIIPNSYPAGSSSIDILATTGPNAPTGACNCAVATGLTSGGTNFQSNSLSSYTVSIWDPGAFELVVRNEVTGNGAVSLMLRNARTLALICNLSIGCGAGGGTITGATANGGLVVTGTTLGLLTSCSSNQVLQFNGTAWVCATIAGSGTVTGTGTNNLIPKWTNGAGGVLGNSGLTDNGTTISTAENIQMIGTGVGVSGFITPAACPAVGTGYANGSANCQGVWGQVNPPAASNGISAGTWGYNNPTNNLSSTPYLTGVFGSGVLAANGSPSQLAGVVGTTQTQGTGTVAISSGVFGVGGVGSGGGAAQTATILEGVGGQAAVWAAAETNPMAAALYAHAPILTGKANHVYGLFAESMAAGGANNPDPWGLFITDSKIFFGGLALTTLTDSVTVTWALASASYANTSLTFTVHSGSRTLNITNPVSGGQYTLKLVQDGTGGEGLILGTGCTWKVSGGGGGAITPSTGPNAVDVLSFIYDGVNCLANFNKNFN